MTYRRMLFENFLEVFKEVLVKGLVLSVVCLNHRRVEASNFFRGWGEFDSLAYGEY